nr:hypothetical protein [Tanacetum cinerariifolium]
MHISQQRGFGTDEGTDIDEQTKGKDESEGDKTNESNDDDDDQDEAKNVNDDDDNEEEGIGRGEFDPIPQNPEESEDDDNNKEDQGLRIGEEERMNEEEEVDELYLFRFEDRVKFLEDNFSNISGIVNQYMHQQMPEAVQEAVQTQTDRLQDSILRENDEFLKTINENMKKIIKEQVKTQVKAQVTRILPRIEESVNAQLEAEVLTRSSHSSRTSYAVAADLLEMELKNILIDKMEGNKSIQRSDEQRNLYKALVEAYDEDKTILDFNTLVKAEVWLRLESKAELDSFFLFKWPVLEPVGALEDLPLVASLLDIEGCFEEVKCFLYLGAEKETLEFSRALLKYQNSARYSLYKFRDLMVVLVVKDFVLGLPFDVIEVSMI